MSLVHQSARITPDFDEDELPEHLAACLDEDDDCVFFRIHGDVVVSQKDVRCLQLAKSAVFSGVLVMIENLGIECDDIQEVLIAGGFGEYLNLENAAAIGLFPSQLLSRTRSVGNSSLEGATQAVLSHAAADALNSVSAECRYIELSTTPKRTRHAMASIRPVPQIPTGSALPIVE